MRWSLRQGRVEIVVTSGTTDREPYAIPAPVPIRTPQLILRPYREGDGAALA